MTRVVAVDPDRAQPHPGGRRDVVHPAVGDVNPVRWRRPGQFSEFPEVTEVRLVGPHPLRRYHNVEWHGKSRRSLREQVLIAIGEDREPPAKRGERAKRLRHVGENRHRRPGFDERPRVLLRDWHAGPPPGQAEPVGEDLPVGPPGGPGLEDRLHPVVSREQRLGVHARDWLQRAEHAGVPVRDRAVAVEGQPASSRHQTSLLEHL